MATEAKQLTIVDEPQTGLVAMLERLTMNPDVPVEKLERLLSMQERIMGKQAEDEFNRAMNKAQSEMGRVAKDAENKQTHSTYATFEALDKKLRPIYSSNGFALSFDTGDSPSAEVLRVLCYLSHSGGHSRTYKIDMPADGKGAKGGDVMTKTHATGSAMSYGRRYLLSAIFNVALGKDDDGNAAGMKLITEKQAADLEALIEEVGADKPKFLEYMKLAKVEDMPALAFNTAVAALRQKAKKGK